MGVVFNKERQFLGICYAALILLPFLLERLGVL